MKYFNLLLLTCCCLISACKSPVRDNSARVDKPNILFLLADDLGYGDLSCFGSSDIETPNLDALAAGGIQLRNFYASSGVCTPSRAAILTGRYPLRFNIRQHFRDIRGEYLPVQEVSLPWLLKHNGYRTFHIGKWHLGGLQEHQCTARSRGEASVNPGPLEHGFDHYLVNLEDTIRGELLKKARLYQDGGRYMVRNDRTLRMNRPRSPTWGNTRNGGLPGTSFFTAPWFHIWMPVSGRSLSTWRSWASVIIPLSFSLRTMVLHFLEAPVILRVERQISMKEGSGFPLSPPGREGSLQE
ncbi:MAG: sulfatase-like hydrolase/transferase [Bacteroidales bacterium]|nr:sulfatase-like hydrolase/transferase [Bacteroidales bacterium]